MKHWTFIPALLIALIGNALYAAQSGDERAAVVRFKIQEIDKSLKIGYAVKIVDLNADGRPDILIPDAARVIWFENPGKSGEPWKLHTIIDDKTAGVIADNVCVDVYDIDGDGKLDIALGADWKPADTKAHGSLQWLRQPANIDQPWEVHPIFASEPTLHRIRFADLGGEKPAIVVAPLNGKGSSKEKLYADTGVRLLAFPIPKDPLKDSWEPLLITDQLHVMHNFFPIDWDKRAKGMELLTASFEGISLLRQTADGKWSATHIGDGEQSKPDAPRGAGEVKVGAQKGGHGLIGTIEPFHGNQVVAYTPPAGGGKSVWTRTVLDDSLKDGHAVFPIDLDGDGTDEIVAGWRGGKPTGLRIYQAGPPGPNGASPWTKFDLDDGVAVEDIACADLNADGRPEIIAVGRATGNVRIYWNLGK